MSVRVVLEALRRRGGRATVAELRVDHFRAIEKVQTLLKQGYVRRVAHGDYELTELGWGKPPAPMAQWEAVA